MSHSTTILRICLLLLASLACVIAQQDYYKTLGGEQPVAMAGSQFGLILTLQTPDYSITDGR